MRCAHITFGLVLVGPPVVSGCRELKEGIDKAGARGKLLKAYGRLKYVLS